MKKSFFINAIWSSILLNACCSKDNNIPYAPQSIIIKNYGGINLTKTNIQGEQTNIQVTNSNGIKIGITPPQTIIDKGDTLFVINPYYSSSGGEFTPYITAILVNKILKRTDTLHVKFSLKKIDSCNENIQIDEAYLNRNKGFIRESSSINEKFIELKYK
jgi:hypothetical protein